jgi:hypothetical protein
MILTLPVLSAPTLTLTQRVNLVGVVRRRERTGRSEHRRRECEANHSVPQPQHASVTPRRGRSRFSRAELHRLVLERGIQARARVHATLPPSHSSRGQRVEHTYERRGALTHLAALDIGRRRG